MPPRKSLDIDVDLAALQAMADKLRADQKLMLGELVLETGVHKLLDADQISDALIPATVKQRWRRRGLRTFDAAAVKEQAGDAGRVSTDMTIATPAEGTGGRRR